VHGGRRDDARDAEDERHVDDVRTDQTAQRVASRPAPTTDWSAANLSKDQADHGACDENEHAAGTFRTREYATPTRLPGAPCGTDPTPRLHTQTAACQLLTSEIMRVARLRPVPRTPIRLAQPVDELTRSVIATRKGHATIGAATHRFGCSPEAGPAARSAPSDSS
jgi:hypothetical protein